MTDLGKVGFQGDTSGLKQVQTEVQTTKQRVQELNQELSKTNAAGSDASAGLNKTAASAKSAGDAMSSHHSGMVKVSDVTKALAQGEADLAKSIDAAIVAARTGASATDGLAAAKNRAGAAARAARAETSALGSSIGEMSRAAANVAAPALSTMGVQIGGISQLAAAARLGVGGLGVAAAGAAVAAVGAVSLALAQNYDEATRAKARLESIGGVKFGPDMANQIEVINKNLGHVAPILQPALESLERFNNLTRDLNPNGIRIFGQGVKDTGNEVALTGEQLRKATEGVFMQLRLGGANIDQALKGTNEFLTNITTKGKVAGDDLRRLSQIAPDAGRAFANAFGGGAKSVETMAKDLDKVPEAVGNTLLGLGKLRDGSKAAYDELEKHPRNVTEATDRVASSFEKLWRSVTDGSGASATVTGALTGVSRVIDGVTESSKPASEAFGKMASSISGAYMEGIKGAGLFNSAIASGFASAGGSIDSFVTQSLATLKEWANKIIAMATSVGQAIASAMSNKGSVSSPSPSISDTGDVGGGSTGTSTYPESQGDEAYASGGQFGVSGAGGTDSQLVKFWATPGEVVTVTPPGGAKPNHPSYAKSGLPAFAEGGQLTVGGAVLSDEQSAASMAKDLVSATISPIIKEQTAALSECIEAVRTAIDAAKTAIVAGLSDIAKATAVVAATVTPIGAATSGTTTAPSVSQSGASSRTGSSFGGSGGGGGGGSSVKDFEDVEKENAKAEQHRKQGEAEQQKADQEAAQDRQRQQQQQQRDDQGRRQAAQRSAERRQAEEREFIKRQRPDYTGPVNPQDKFDPRSLNENGMPRQRPSDGKGGIGSDAGRTGDQIKPEDIQKVSDAVKENTGTTQSIGESQQSALDSVSQSAMKQASDLTQAANTLQQQWQDEKEQTQATQKVSEATDQLKETTATTGEGTIEGITAVDESITGQTDTLGNSISESGEKTTQIGSDITTSVSDASSSITDGINSAGESIVTAIQSISDAITSAASSSGGGGSSDSGGGGGDDGYATGGQFTVGGQGGTDSQKIKFKSNPGDVVTVTPPGGTEPKNPIPGANPMGGSGTKGVSFWATPGEVVTVTPKGAAPPANPNPGPLMTKGQSNAFADGGQVTLGDAFNQPSISSQSSDLIASHAGSLLSNQSAVINGSISETTDRMLQAISGSTDTLQSTILGVARSIPDPRPPSAPSAGGISGFDPSDLIEQAQQNHAEQTKKRNQGMIAQYGGAMVTGSNWFAWQQFLKDNALAHGGQGEVTPSGRLLAFADGGQATVPTDEVTGGLDNRMTGQTAAITRGIEGMGNKVATAMTTHTNTLTQDIGLIKDRFDAFRSGPSASSGMPASSVSSSMGLQYPAADGGVFTVPGGQSGTDQVDMNIKASPGEKIFVLTPDKANKLKKGAGGGAGGVVKESLDQFFHDAQGFVSSVPSASSAPKSSMVTKGEILSNSASSSAMNKQPTVVIQVQPGVQADDFIRSRAQIARAMGGR